MLKLVNHLTDDQLRRMYRGGHDSKKMYAAYKAAVDEFYGKYLARRGNGNRYFERSFAGLSEEVYGTMWGPSEFNVQGNLKDFDRADKNNDGKITRAEYRAAFANKDAKRKPAKTAANERDPGFNALDRNNDGYITRAEARGNPHLAKNFKAADRNNDGKLNRAEYLAAMTKKDVNTAKAKVDNKLDRNATASTGATAPPQ